MIVGKRIPAHVPRILVPATEDLSLVRFAAKYAKAHQAALMSIFVQPQDQPDYAHLSVRGREAMVLSGDDEAQSAFATIRAVCQQEQVPLLQMYTVHRHCGDVLLDHAATWGVEAVIMGASRKREQLPPACEPVLAQVYKDLPSSIPLVIHT